jgi:predicted nuclease of predicted toxin-antitoxin system
LDFKVDENLPAEIAQLLNAAGHSAATVLAEGLGGASDEAVLAAARAERRILVTLDTGFADIRLYPPAESPGLLVLRLRRQDKAHVVDIVQRLLPRLELQDLDKRLWIVEERRIRVRS